MANEFFEKYKDPRWQQKRLKVFEHYGWECQSCFATSKQLHVHHKRYLKGRNPWDYQAEQLAVVCGDCHKALGGANDLINKVLSRVPVSDPIGAYDLPFVIAGIYGMEIEFENDGQRLLFEAGGKLEGLYFDLLKQWSSNKKAADE